MFIYCIYSHRLQCLFQCFFLPISLPGRVARLCSLSLVLWSFAHRRVVAFVWATVKYMVLALRSFTQGYVTRRAMLTFKKSQPQSINDPKSFVPCNGPRQKNTHGFFTGVFIGCFLLHHFWFVSVVQGSAEMHILWLPPAASKALGLPHRQLSCQLQQLLGLQPKMREADASMEPSKGVKRKAADPPPKRGGFLQLLQRSANKEVLMSAWGCKFWMSRKVNRVA